MVVAGAWMALLGAPEFADPADRPDGSGPATTGLSVGGTVLGGVGSTAGPFTDASRRCTSVVVVADGAPVGGRGSSMVAAEL